MDKAKAAATLGRIKSEKKTAAVRENGKKGGRPTLKYYRVDAARNASYGMQWDGTILAIRPDGTGYLLTDRYEADRNGSECYRQYVDDKLRLWPAAVAVADDAAYAKIAVCGADASVAEAIEYMGAETVIRRLIEVVSETVKKTIDANSAVR